MAFISARASRPGAAQQRRRWGQPVVEPEPEISGDRSASSGASSGLTRQSSGASSSVSGPALRTSGNFAGGIQPQLKPWNGSTRVSPHIRKSSSSGSSATVDKENIQKATKAVAGKTGGLAPQQKLQPATKVNSGLTRKPFGVLQPNHNQGVMKYRAPGNSRGSQSTSAASKATVQSTASVGSVRKTPLQMLAKRVSRLPTPLMSPCSYLTPPECRAMLDAVELAIRDADGPPGTDVDLSDNLDTWLARAGINAQVESPLRSQLQVLYERARESLQLRQLVDSIKLNELDIATREAEENARHLEMLAVENEELSRVKDNLAQDNEQLRDELQQMQQQLLAMLAQQQQQQHATDAPAPDQQQQQQRRAGDATPSLSEAGAWASDQQTVTFGATPAATPSLEDASAWVQGMRAGTVQQQAAAATPEVSHGAAPSGLSLVSRTPPYMPFTSWAVAMEQGPCASAPSEVAPQDGSGDVDSPSNTTAGGQACSGLSLITSTQHPVQFAQWADQGSPAASVNAPVLLPGSVAGTPQQRPLMQQQQTRGLGSSSGSGPNMAALPPWVLPSPGLTATASPGLSVLLQPPQELASLQRQNGAAAAAWPSPAGSPITTRDFAGSTSSDGANAICSPLACPAAMPLAASPAAAAAVSPAAASSMCNSELTFGAHSEQAAESLSLQLAGEPGVIGPDEQQQEQVCSKEDEAESWGPTGAEAVVDGALCTPNVPLPAGTPSPGSPQDQQEEQPQQPQQGPGVALGGEATPVAATPISPADSACTAASFRSDQFVTPATHFKSAVSSPGSAAAYHTGRSLALPYALASAGRSTARAMYAAGMLGSTAKAPRERLPAVAEARPSFVVPLGAAQQPRPEAVHEEAEEEEQQQSEPRSGDAAADTDTDSPAATPAASCGSNNVAAASADAPVFPGFDLTPTPAPGTGPHAQLPAAAQHEEATVTKPAHPQQQQEQSPSGGVTRLLEMLTTPQASCIAQAEGWTPPPCSVGEEGFLDGQATPAVVPGAEAGLADQGSVFKPPAPRAEDVTAVAAVAAGPDAVASRQQALLLTPVRSPAASAAVGCSPMQYPQPEDLFTNTACSNAAAAAVAASPAHRRRLAQALGLAADAGDGDAACGGNHKRVRYSPGASPAAASNSPAGSSCGSLVAESVCSSNDLAAAGPSRFGSAAAADAAAASYQADSPAGSSCVEGVGSPAPPTAVAEPWWLAGGSPACSPASSCASAAGPGGDVVRQGLMASSPSFTPVQRLKAQPWESPAAAARGAAGIRLVPYTPYSSPSAASADSPSGLSACSSLSCLPQAGEPAVRAAPLAAASGWAAASEAVNDTVPGCATPCSSPATSSIASFASSHSGGIALDQLHPQLQAVNSCHNPLFDSPSPVGSPVTPPARQSQHQQRDLGVLSLELELGAGAVMDVAVGDAADDGALRVDASCESAKRSIRALTSPAGSDSAPSPRFDGLSLREEGAAVGAGVQAAVFAAALAAAADDGRGYTAARSAGGSVTSRASASSAAVVQAGEQLVAAAPFCAVNTPVNSPSLARNRAAAAEQQQEAEEHELQEVSSPSAAAAAAEDQLPAPGLLYMGAPSATPSNSPCSLQPLPSDVGSMRSGASRRSRLSSGASGPQSPWALAPALPMRPLAAGARPSPTPSHSPASASPASCASSAHKSPGFYAAMRSRGVVAWQMMAAAAAAEYGAGAPGPEQSPVHSAGSTGSAQTTDSCVSAHSRLVFMNDAFAAADSPAAGVSGSPCLGGINVGVIRGAVSGAASAGRASAASPVPSSPASRVRMDAASIVGAAMLMAPWIRDASPTPSNSPAKALAAQRQAAAEAEAAETDGQQAAERELEQLDVGEGALGVEPVQLQAALEAALQQASAPLSDEASAAAQDAGDAPNAACESGSSSCTPMPAPKGQALCHDNALHAEQDACITPAQALPASALLSADAMSSAGSSRLMTGSAAGPAGGVSPDTLVMHNPLWEMCMGQGNVHDSHYLDDEEHHHHQGPAGKSVQFSSQQLEGAPDDATPQLMAEVSFSGACAAATPVAAALGEDEAISAAAPTAAAAALVPARRGFLASPMPSFYEGVETPSTENDSFYDGVHTPETGLSPLHPGSYLTTATTAAQAAPAAAAAAVAAPAATKAASSAAPTSSCGSGISGGAAASCASTGSRGSKAPSSKARPILQMLEGAAAAAAARRQQREAEDKQRLQKKQQARGSSSRVGLAEVTNTQRNGRSQPPQPKQKAAPAGTSITAAYWAPSFSKPVACSATERVVFTVNGSDEQGASLLASPQPQPHPRTVVANADLLLDYHGSPAVLRMAAATAAPALAQQQPQQRTRPVPASWREAPVTAVAAASFAAAAATAAAGGRAAVRAGAGAGKPSVAVAVTKAQVALPAPAAAAKVAQAQKRTASNSSGGSSSSSSGGSVKARATAPAAGAAGEPRGAGDASGSSKAAPAAAPAAAVDAPAVAGPAAADLSTPLTTPQPAGGATTARRRQRKKGTPTPMKSPPAQMLLQVGAQAALRALPGLPPALASAAAEAALAVLKAKGVLPPGAQLQQQQQSQATGTVGAAQDTSVPALAAVHAAIQTKSAEVQTTPSCTAPAAAKPDLRQQQPETAGAKGAAAASLAVGAQRQQQQAFSFFPPAVVSVPATSAPAEPFSFAKRSGALAAAATAGVATVMLAATAAAAAATVGGATPPPAAWGAAAHGSSYYDEDSDCESHPGLHQQVVTPSFVEEVPAVALHGKVRKARLMRRGVSEAEERELRRRAAALRVRISPYFRPTGAHGGAAAAAAAAGHAAAGGGGIGRFRLPGGNGGARGGVGASASAIGVRLSPGVGTNINTSGGGSFLALLKEAAGGAASGAAAVPAAATATAPASPAAAAGLRQEVISSRL